MPDFSGIFNIKMSEEIKTNMWLGNRSLEIINLVTIIGCLVYFVLLFAIPQIKAVPSQIGVVLLIAIISYRTYKKPDFWWTAIALVWLLGMYGTTIFSKLFI